MKLDRMSYRKIAVIGCGFVGSASAFSIMQSGIFSEIVMIDADNPRAEGEAMDISHGIPLSSPTKIYAGDYNDVGDASLVVITAGANQKPGETRLDLAKKNISILKSILNEIKKSGFGGILLIVANPVDVLTSVAVKLSGLPENMVLGSGTVLDSSRLRYELGKRLLIDPRNINAYVLGEHGDSEFVAWSNANVAGIQLSKFCEMRGYTNFDEEKSDIVDAVKNSAYRIIERKKATYYGIAISVKKICEVIMRDEKAILPVSSVLHGEYDIDGVSLSIPTIVGKNGIETRIPIQLSDQELESLKKSSNALKDVLSKNDF